MLFKFKKCMEFNGYVVLEFRYFINFIVIKMFNWRILFSRVRILSRVVVFC